MLRHQTRALSLLLAILTPAACLSAPASQPTTLPSGFRQSVDGTLEFHAKDADVRDLIKQVGTARRLSVIFARDVKGTVSVDLYGVTFTQAMQAICEAGELAYEQQGAFLRVYDAKTFAAMAKARIQPVVRTFRMRFIPAADAKILLAPAISSEGQISLTPAAQVGIAANNTSSGGNNYATDDLLIIRDYPANLDMVEQLLKEIDARPQQILIETTILSVTLENTNALGINLHALSGIDFKGMMASSDMSSSPAVTAQPVPGGIKGGLNNNVSGNVPSGGLSMGLMSNHIGVFIRALESTADTTVIGNPKLLVLNKQKGEILVGKEDGYITTVANQNVISQQVEFLKTGTRLVVRPFVADKDSIRLEVHPESSDGKVVLQGTYVLPSKDTTETTSNVLVRDGHTLIIAGLFREKVSRSRTQVPGLGNLWGIGALFRSRSDEMRREEIIILVTPHIVQPEDTDADALSHRQRMDQSRLGNRQGLMWFGRTALTDQQVAKAGRALNEGRPDQAVFCADMALALEPTSSEARRLRDAAMAQMEQKRSRRKTSSQAIERVLDKPRATSPTTRP